MRSRSQRFPPPLRVVKFLVSVLCHSFGIVAGFAESLPVVPIPEQFSITPMRNDVIHNRCLHISSLGKASYTKWVGLQVNSPCFLPVAPVSFLTGGLPVVLVQRFVFLTVHSAVGNKPAAARMLAWGFRPMWHNTHALFGSVLPPGQCHGSHHSHCQLKSAPLSCGTAARSVPASFSSNTTMPPAFSLYPCVSTPFYVQTGERIKPRPANEKGPEVFHSKPRSISAIIMIAQPILKNSTPLVHPSLRKTRNCHILLQLTFLLN